jgi:hypothetical protein
MTTTTPLLAACPRCRARVLEVRWDHHEDTLIGAPALDPVTLDPHQVLACVVAGIPLWQVHEYAGHPVTSQRTAWWPTAPLPGHIAPAHRCGTAWDAFPLDLSPDTTLTPDTAPF